MEKSRLAARILAAVTGLALLGGVPAASAGDGYGAVMGSYVLPDSKRATDNGYGASLLGGVRLASGVNGELNLYGHQTSPDGGGEDVKSYGGTVDLRFDLCEGPVVPFVLAGLGGQQDKLAGLKDGMTAFDVGVGVLAGLFRGEVRAYSLTDVDSIPGHSHAVDFRLNLGLQFGGSGASAAPVVATAMAPAAAPAPIVDTDGDGVADSADKCPGTPRGTEVDRNGCANISKVVLKGVNFGTGSSTLLPAASETLRSVASAMKADPALKVEVGGYTDSVGDAAKNLALSERRAKAVKAFLVHEGIDGGRLATKGYGQASPADTNDTAAGRANNRRVAFKLL